MNLYIKVGLLILFLWAFSMKLFSQDYLLSDGGSATTCTGVFLDPGGNSNYSGETSTWTYTICNSTPGQPIYVDFNTFSLWSNSCIWGASVDELNIYNGSGTTNLIGSYVENNNPGLVIGTAGCLTFQFVRQDFGGFLCDANSGEFGWSANISCTPPPADGSSCIESYQFCTGTSYNFPNSTITTAITGPNYDCLGSQPNPVWYTMRIDQPGPIQIGISQTTGPNGTGTGLDVDFVLWGPFLSFFDGCTSIQSGIAEPIQSSFDAAPTETVGIGAQGGVDCVFGVGQSTPPPAQIGEYYILLITNYSGSSGYIEFSQTGGLGSADCSFICGVDLIASPTACSSNTYTLDGTLTLSSGPGISIPNTGTVTISTNCGGTPQIFNLPLTNNSLSYSIPDLIADGATCIVTAEFLDFSSCNAIQTYDAPPNCNPTCIIDPFTAIPSACGGTDVYNVAGTVSFSNPPSSGTLSITNSCGAGTGPAQTFDAPFISPINYNFSNLSANGNQCTVTATFSANNGVCTETSIYNAPPPCSGPQCVQNPFCSSAIDFPAGTDQPDAEDTDPLNNYDCLFSSPNPAWYYMQVDQPGNLNINITNSANTDVDFIMYGPFANLSEVNTNCNNFGNGTTSNTVVDCSYSGSANETAVANGVLSGQVYVLLITNFSNTTTDISFENTGNASTNCNIITNCSVTAGPATISPCNTNDGTYGVSGTFDLVDPPSSGTLTITNNCGGTPIVINSPFNNSVSYSFSGLIANELPCVISASFSASTCSGSYNYIAPPFCTCQADVGTFNSNVDGVSVSQNSLIQLCYGEEFNGISNNDWNEPNEVTGSVDPNDPVYDPGIAWYIYSCPPTIALDPSMAFNTGMNINDDPCNLGVINTTPNFSNVNDLALINSYPAGTFTNNTVYFVPVTFYSLIDGIYSFVMPGELDCYEMSSPIAVQYLPEITYTSSFNCADGTASITLNGGSPQINGTNYSVVPGSLLPNTASFVNTSTGNNGTIIIENLTTGNYSFDVVDDVGCPKTITGDFIGPQSASISYSTDVFCINSSDDSPVMIGTPGGIYSSGIGLNLDPTTGIIDFTNSVSGNYTITYITPGPLCPATATFDITVEEFLIVDGGPDQTLCIGKPVILSASGADMYDWNLGLQDGIPYLPSFGETEFYVVGSSLAGCKGYDTVLVTVHDNCIPEEEVVFWVPNTFTPDGDQYNQIFKPIFYSGFDPFEFEFYIYNRWGELIWECRDVKVGWDGSYFKGRKVMEGSYNWKIRFKLLNNDEKRTVIGHVNVLR
jgi:gliding motility-associated-like protein